jgi:RNA ligase (TIGR02306 family)
MQVEEDFRKLASICIVDNIEEIIGADNIIKATVKGWTVVSKKGNFNIGDKCIYVEIDSLFPSNNPAFNEFKGPIKTRVIRGIVSQGVLLPPKNYLPEIVDGINLDDLPIGTNVTNILGITKYTEDLVVTTDTKFPNYLPKTDEERVQNIFKKIIKAYPNATFTETEKLDGTSFSAFLDSKDKMQVCSRNCVIDENSNETFLYTTAISLGIEDLLLRIKKQLGFTPMLQGECTGPKIQSNPYKLTSKQIYFFRLYSISDQKFIDYDTFLKASGDFGFNTVPILSRDFKLPNTVNELLKHVDGNSALCADTKREGSVFIMNSIPSEDTKNNETNDQEMTEMTEEEKKKESWNKIKFQNFEEKNRISFKAISNEFLLSKKKARK